MKKSKLLAVIITVLATVCMFTLFASAEEPVQEGFVYNAEGGYYEYYEYGYKVVDCEIWISGYNANFRFDEEGRMLDDEWYLDEEGNKYYYLPGGYRADNDRVFVIDGKHYAFNHNGVLYRDCICRIYSNELDGYSWGRAREDGTLYVDQWYLDEETNEWYYYGADGTSPKGVTYIGGNPYYIGYEGRMTTGTFYVTVGNDEKLYVYRTKENGVLFRNEWDGDNAKWYYTDDCSAAQGYMFVDGAYHLFSEYGFLYTYTVEKDFLTGISYTCDRNGIAKPLNVNGWSYVDNTYYYCENGDAYKDGIYKIGDAYYFFQFHGKMLQNETYFAPIEPVGFVQYRAKESGALYQNEWYSKTTNNGTGTESYLHKEYYGEDFNGCREGFHTIDGDLYYFISNGVNSNHLLDYIDDAVYVTDADCKLVKYNNCWILNKGNWYYVENNKLIKNNVKEIGGVLYGFDYQGVMYENCIVEIYDRSSSTRGYKYYIATKGGAILTTPGWTVFEGKYYYVTEDGSLHQGELTLGDTNYYLNPAMIEGTYGAEQIYNDATDEYDYKLYVVLPNGVKQSITAEGYYNTQDGRVLVENGKLYQGWKQIDGNWYYLNPAFIEGQARYIDSSYYYFDNTGKMVANGWHYRGNSYIYADEYGRLTTGAAEIGGVLYGFDSNGTLLTDGYFHFDDEIYVTDANGRAYLLESDGWNLVNGYWYFVKEYDDGYDSYKELATDYMYLVENDKEVVYSFSWNSGRMLTNYYDGDCYFGADGRRVTKSWLLTEKGWMYFDPYQYWNGCYNIDGVDYYFDNGVMQTNGTYYDIYGGYCYVVDASGVVTSSFPVSDGIHYSGNTAYMYKNGELYDGWYGEYYFDNGYMAIDTSIEYNGNLYYLDGHGKYIRGWYKSGDSWIYADQSGVVVTNQWVQSGSSWYYASEYGWMYNGGVFYIEAEDKYAKFDKNGIYQGYVDYRVPTGTPYSWEYRDGNWYYYTSTGVAAYSCEMLLGNTWYAFDFEGKMIADNFYNQHYYQASGARLEASYQWALINNKWVYFGSDSKVKTGWINLNGTRYYIDYYIKSDNNYTNYIYEMVAGYAVIYNEVYRFSASGAYEGKHTTDGWVQLYNGNFAYIKDGKVLTEGVYNINGTNYAFDSSGEMLADGGNYIEGFGFVYASASGALYTPGWHNTANGWIYVKSNGRACESGVCLINGVQYFFSAGYWVP